MKVVYQQSLVFMTKLKSGAEVEIYYFICFILCFFFIWFYADTYWERVRVPTLYFPFCFFLCVLWMYIVSETFRGENLSLFWKTIILPDESVGICVRMKKKKDETLFHALLLPSVFTKWTLFSCRIIWLHVKRVTWVKDRTVTLRNWTCCDSCTENEFMSILSDFFPFQLRQGNHFRINMYYGALGDCKQPPGL